MIGETFAGRYRIEEKLMEGRALATYLAVDIDLGTEVEVDMLTLGEAPCIIHAQRREQILDAATRACGPHVSNLYLWGEDTEAGLLYMVREKNAGISLAEVLAGTGELPSQQAVEIAQAAVEVLVEIYGRGLFYMGINPGQIYLDAAGRIRFIRVGYAWMIEEAEPLLAARASPYRAPETDGGKEGSRTSDVYSLAVMISEMLPRFQGHDRLHALLERAMDSIPKQRPSSPRLLLEELETALGGSGREVVPERGETPGFPSRRYEGPRPLEDDISPSPYVQLTRRPRRHVLKVLLLMILVGFLAWLVFSAIAGLLAGGKQSAQTSESPQEVPRVTLPDLQGLTAGEAEEVLTELGLECSSRDAPSRLWSAGRVSAQEPAEGSILSPGETVCLVISTGRDQGEESGGEKEEVDEAASPVTAPVETPAGDEPGTESSPSLEVPAAPEASPATNASPRAVPVASSRSGAAPLYVALDGSGSCDPDGEIIRYVWYCGDGTVLEGITAQHVYDPAVIPARFQLVLQVFDREGASDSSSLILEVY